MLKLPVLALFLCFVSSCKLQTPEERKREKVEMFQRLDNQLVDRGLLMQKPETKPAVVQVQVPESKPMPDEVSVDGEKNGTVHAFLFDNKVCFSKEKFRRGKVGCLDLKTQKNVFINASQINIPDDVYVDIEANASIHVFSFQGKTCLAKNKFERGLMNCWDPKEMENVIIDLK